MIDTIWRVLHISRMLAEIERRFSASRAKVIIRAKQIWAGLEPGRCADEGPKLRILMLSSVHAVGYGVGVVMNQQARYLAARGHIVFAGGPKSKNEFSYPGCVRVYVGDAESAANLARSLDVDCIVAHTPPYFSTVRWVGRGTKFISYDYGEPPPHLFPHDAAGREAINTEKIACFAMADRVFAISEAVKSESPFKDVSVIPLGNSHLATWCEDFRTQRRVFRAKREWQRKVIILCVCRFYWQERMYKGIDSYVSVMAEFRRRFTESSRDVEFVLCGKCSEEDAEAMRRAGLTVFPNVSDVELICLYAAADVYASFSKWEGYNLGIAQALAMGLPVVASDIEAHQAFGIHTSNSVQNNAAKIHELALRARVDRTEPDAYTRKPVVWNWDLPLARFACEIEALCLPPPSETPAPASEGQ